MKFIIELMIFRHNSIIVNVGEIKMKKKEIDYDKLANLDYLERKKYFNHAPMPLSERAAIFKAFDALQGYQEELRKVEKRHAKQFEREERIYYGKDKSEKK